MKGLPVALVSLSALEWHKSSSKEDLTRRDLHHVSAFEFSIDFKNHLTGRPEAH